MKLLECVFRIKMWIVSLFQSEQMEDDLKMEFEHHIELETRRNIEQGMPPSEARRIAILNFGSRMNLKEDCRASWGLQFFENFMSDICYGFRQIRKQKTNTTIIVFTLAICMAANTLVFNVSDKLVRNPYNYQDVEKIVKIGSFRPQKNKNKINHISVPLFNLAKDHNHSFEHIGLVDPAEKFDLKANSKNTRLTIDKITPQIWDVIGVQPVAGRFFNENDIQLSAGKLVVISESLWKRLRSDRSEVIGTAVLLDGELYQVIGVAPQSLYFGFHRADAWIPWIFSADQLDYKTRYRLGYIAIGKLKSNTSIEQVNQDFENIYKAYLNDNPTDKEYHDKTGYTIAALGINQSSIQYFPEFGLALKAMNLATLLVLIIGCSNIGGIFIAMSENRLQEYAMRRALGASTWRLSRQIINEMILYFLIAGIISLVFLNLGFSYTSWIQLDKVPWAPDWRINTQTIILTLVISISCGFLTAIIPLFSILKKDLIFHINSGNRTNTGSSSKRKLQNIYIVIQIALSFVLLTLAILLIHNMNTVLAKDIGFEVENRMAVKVNQPFYRFKPESIERLPLQQRILEKLKSLPEVMNVTTSSRIPMDYNALNYSNFQIPTYEVSESETAPVALKLSIRPDYFKSIGANILMGTDFSDSDRENSEKVVIISQSIKDIYFKDTNPIDTHLICKNGHHRIIGVVKDIQEKPLFFNITDISKKDFSLYFPWNQGWNYGFDAPNYILELNGESSQAQGLIEKAILEIDPNATMEFIDFSDTYDVATIAQQLPMKISIVIACLAVFLSGLGLYGFINHSIAIRSKEFGIRIALGAKTSTLIIDIMRTGFNVVIPGMISGLVIAIIVCIQMNPLLPEINTLSLGLFIIVILIVTTTWFVASIYPFIRTIKLNIVDILREE